LDPEADVDGTVTCPEQGMYVQNEATVLMEGIAQSLKEVSDSPFK